MGSALMASHGIHIQESIYWPNLPFSHDIFTLLCQHGAHSYGIERDSSQVFSPLLSA
jgi:hypothetical protein